MEKNIETALELITQALSDNRAAALANFIATNWHYCPIDSSISAEGCMCWGSNMCARCILEHANQLIKQ